MIYECVQCQLGTLFLRDKEDVGTKFLQLTLIDFVDAREFRIFVSIKN